MLPSASAHYLRPLNSVFFDSYVLFDISLPLCLSVSPSLSRLARFLRARARACVCVRGYRFAIAFCPATRTELERRERPEDEIDSLHTLEHLIPLRAIFQQCRTTTEENLVVVRSITTPLLEVERTHD